jgi:hypothetical protein
MQEVYYIAAFFGAAIIGVLTCIACCDAENARKEDADQ